MLFRPLADAEIGGGAALLAASRRTLQQRSSKLATGDRLKDLAHLRLEDRAQLLGSAIRARPGDDPVRNAQAAIPQRGERGGPDALRQIARDERAFELPRLEARGVWPALALSSVSRWISRMACAALHKDSKPAPELVDVIEILDYAISIHRRGISAF